MKRPAFVVALLLAVAATFLYLLGVGAVLVFAAIILCFAFVLFILKNKGIRIKDVAVLLVAVLVVIGFAVKGIKKVNVEKTFSDKNCKVLCVVTEEPKYYEEFTQFEVKSLDDGHLFGYENTLKRDDVKFILQIPSYMTEASADIGDRLLVDVTFKRLDESRAKYNYYKGIYFDTTCHSAKKVGHDGSVYHYFVAIRRYIKGLISEHLSGDSEALMNGMLLGDKILFSDELYYNFKSCGLSHLVAVSGLHINIICLAMWHVLSRIVSKRMASFVMFLPLVTIVAVTGFTPSAIRAGIMFTLFLLGRMFLKTPDTLNSLGVAICGMLAVNPYYISSVSFQLSCAATAGVIFVAPYSDRLGEILTKKIRFKTLKRVLKTTVAIIMLAISANIFTLPFVAVHFGFVSVISPIVSVFITPAATYLLTLGVLGVFLSFIPVLGYYFAEVVFGFTDILSKYMALVAKIGASIPMSYVPVDSGKVLLCVGAVLCIFAVWILLNCIGGTRMVVSMSLSLLVLTLVGSALGNMNRVKFTVLKADDTCVVISKGSNCVVVGFDGNEDDYYALKSHLKINGIRNIEAVYVGNSADSQTAATMLNEDYSVDEFYALSGARMEFADFEIKSLESGKVHRILENVSVECISLSGVESLKVSIFEKSVLLTAATDMLEDADLVDFDLLVLSDGEMGNAGVFNRRLLSDNVLLEEKQITEDGLNVLFNEGKDVIFSGN